MFRRAPRRWLAAAVMALAVAPAWAGNAPIYKCFDNHLALVYTDVPCKDGEQLDIRAGDADPKAVARLDRAIDQLDQSAAQRMLDDRHAADTRSAAAWLPGGSEDDLAPQAPSAPYAYGYGYGGYGGYGGYYPYPPFMRPMHHSRPHRSHGTVPAMPHLPRL